MISERTLACRSISCKSCFTFTTVWTIDVRTSSVFVTWTGNGRAFIDIWRWINRSAVFFKDDIDWVWVKKRWCDWLLSLIWNVVTRRGRRFPPLKYEIVREIANLECCVHICKTWFCLAMFHCNEGSFENFQSRDINNGFKDGVCIYSDESGMWRWRSG